MKQMLWIVATAVASALAAAYATRVMDSMWRSTTRQPPPKMPRWSPLVALPIRRGVQSHYGPSTA